MKQDQSELATIYIASLTHTAASSITGNCEHKQQSRAKNYKHPIHVYSATTRAELFPPVVGFLGRLRCTCCVHSNGQYTK